uniref:Protein Flattop n=1 Tax=Hucho hucho TaxID=62062 RepID=A0A4W5LKW1_9TELE
RFKERPSAAEGHTIFIASDRGHLLPGVKRGSAWPDFKGTWELPARLPKPPPLQPQTARRKRIRLDTLSLLSFPLLCYPLFRISFSPLLSFIISSPLPSFIISSPLCSPLSSPFLYALLSPL